LIICDKKGQIIFLGTVFAGSVVDYNVFKDELGAIYYHGKVLHVDLGFMGISDFVKLKKGEKRDKTVKIRQAIEAEKQIDIAEKINKNKRIKNEKINTHEVQKEVEVVPVKEIEIAKNITEEKEAEIDLEKVISIHIPHKKKRVKKGEPKDVLSALQIKENKLLAKERVIVEHAIGGLKRYFILRHEHRAKIRKKLIDAIELCSGLWNFRKGFSNSTCS
jgi:hypothetical protein